MARWADIETDAPEFAARVRERFDAGTNKTLATLRRDGSPRISGTELQFDGGDVTLGMMPDSMKLRDVMRDARVAIHSPTVEPPADPQEWRGDAKFAGTLAPTVAPTDNAVADAGYFRLEISEVVLTFVEGDELVVESWHDGRGWRRVTRK